MTDRDEHQNVTAKSGIVYAAVLSVLLSIVSFLVVGWLLDRWLDTAPWLVVSGIILGTVIGFYRFIRLISKIS